MEPNKFEKYIKSEFKQREIQPTKAAWSKLSNQLDEIGNKEKRSYKWYAVAAGIIGLLVVSAIMLSRDSNFTETSIPVVNSSRTDEHFNDVSKELEEQTEQKEMVSTPTTPTTPAMHIVVKQKELESRSVALSSSKLEVMTAEMSKDQVDLADTSKTDEEIIYSKVLELVAQVDQLEQTNEDLTDLEVDSLLRKAQQEILAEKLFNTDNSVDALALLSEAEEELDKTFRDQIFESLKTGFLKVRTAVADRNN